MPVNDQRTTTTTGAAQQQQPKVRVRFTQDASYPQISPNRSQNFKAGKVYEMTQDFADRWVRRGVADMEPNQTASEPLAREVGGRATEEGADNDDGQPTDDSAAAGNRTAARTSDEPIAADFKTSMPYPQMRARAQKLSGKMPASRQDAEAVLQAEYDRQQTAKANQANQT